MNLLIFNNYPIRAAEIATMARRSLGIGYIGLAHYLAKNGVEDTTDSGRMETAFMRLTEAFQYYLISKSTVNLARRKVLVSIAAEQNTVMEYLPIDTYKKMWTK